MIKVWGRTNSINVQKVMWTIGELGLDFERIDAGGPFGGLDTPEYGRMNPNRKIPTILDGNTVVWESNSCVRYLAAKYGAGSLWPEDPGLRSEADRWMDWMLTTLMPDMTIVFWQTIRTPPEKRDMPAVRAAAERLGPIWALLDGQLADRPFVGGSTFTMGDIPVGCAWWRYRNLPIDRPPQPHIEAWFERLASRPAYRTHVMLPVT